MEIPRIEGLELNEGQAITRFTAEDLTTLDSVPHRVLAGETLEPREGTVVAAVCISCAENGLPL